MKSPWMRFLREQLPCSPASPPSSPRPWSGMPVGHLLPWNDPDDVLAEDAAARAQAEQIQARSVSAGH